MHEYTVSDYLGYECHDFLFEGREAKVVIPKKRDPKSRWIIKTEYFVHFPNFQVMMLERGFHLVYVANITRWMVPDDVDVKDRFAEFLVREYGLNEKCVPVGMSCGGLHAVYFAAKYPERIAALYLDAPVMNLLSCPAGVGRNYELKMLDELTKATGRTIKDLINYREHPIDKKDILLNNSIPIIMVYGDSDTVVPYDENGEVLEKFYRENGGIIETIGKKDCGHHPHGLDDCTPIADFIEKYYS